MVRSGLMLLGLCLALPGQHGGEDHPWPQDRPTFERELGKSDLAIKNRAEILAPALGDLVRRMRIATRGKKKRIDVEVAGAKAEPALLQGIPVRGPDDGTRYRFLCAIQSAQVLRRDRVDLVGKFSYGPRSGMAYRYSFIYKNGAWRMAAVTLVAVF